MWYFADLSDGGGVEKLLSKLLVLEGKSILFWEVSKPVRIHELIPISVVARENRGAPDVNEGF